MFDNKVDIYLSNKMNLFNQNFFNGISKNKETFFLYVQKLSHDHHVTTFGPIKHRFYKKEKKKKEDGFNNSLKSPITY